MIILFPLVGKLGDNYRLIFAFGTVAIIARIVLIFIVVVVTIVHVKTNPDYSKRGYGDRIR